MSERDGKSVVRAYFDAVNKGQLTDDLLAFMSEDVTWWIQQASPSAGTYEGHAGIKRLFSIDIPIFSAPLQVKIVRMVGEGATVAAEVEIRTKNKDGKDYFNHYSFWFDVQDGKIRSVREYLDTLYAQQVLFDPAGIAPKQH
jgi:ketosteroid isomerase-like protein